MKRDPIMARMDAALEKMAFRGMDVRAIYLTEADREQFTKEWTRYWRRELKSKAIFHPLSYREYHVRTGTTSIVYSTHGVGVKIPTRLSRRTKVAA